MTVSLRPRAWMFAVALLAGVASAGARPQNPIQSVDTSQPIVIKSAPPTSRTIKFLGEFVSSTPNSVTVRDRINTFHLHTFMYAPQVQTQMSHIAAHGGYRYGDKMEIDYALGTDVASRIAGKPTGKKPTGKSK